MNGILVPRKTELTGTIMEPTREEPFDRNRLFKEAIASCKIIARKSPYPKCNRCWNHTSDVKYSSYWLDTLCGRCAKVLCDLEEKEEWFPGKQNMVSLKNKHMIYPVIHVKSEEQAIRNTKIAKDAKCDGVFLINHKITSEELLVIHAKVAQEFPKWWIGINCLGMSNIEICELATPEISGIWTDNALINTDSEVRPIAALCQQILKQKEWKGIYFGGVAFKYQPPIEDLEKACRIAMKYIDVITTSGPGTAQAAKVNKIQRMKGALGEWPLAIASGITPNNVEDYLDKADCFLVASGISKTWAELDEALVKQLVEKIRDYEKD